MTVLTDDNLYESVTLSLMRYVEDFRAEVMPEAEYVNWDAHSNIGELPEADVIGLAGVGLAEDEDKKYEVTFGVLVSTWNDANLNRLTAAVSKMFGRVKPGRTIRVYALDAAGENAVDKTFMVAALPRAVTPVSKAEVRAVQGVECRLLLDPGALTSLR